MVDVGVFEQCGVLAPFAGNNVAADLVGIAARTSRQE
jgi:hypothetical protein